ncbi:MAG TPA: HEAT repeat domain-containing protein [Vicinamibacterales bacterium]|jgi:hypothetical protein|nr:HEAT repeat domain-containing protein [Vicinamibacterales bacterium]
MTRRLAIVAFALSVAPALAQPALLTNAQVRTLPAGTLGRTVEQQVAGITDVGWIAYQVPLVAGDHMMCDWSNDSRRAPATTVKLEGGDTLFVFLRVEQRALTKVRMFSEGCTIDAGGVPVIWLEGAQPAQSVSLLASFMDSSRPRRVVDGALGALAMHADASASAALVAAAKNGASGQVRGQALFWVAQRAGSQAIPTISEAIDRDPDTDVKKRAVFALSQLPANEGVPKLIEVASSHSNPAVRKQAMFWLGQSKDPRALAFFERILFAK